MEENKNLWDKTSEEYTFGDVVKVNAIVVIGTIAAFVAITMTVTLVEKVGAKIRRRKYKTIKTEVAN